MVAGTDDRATRDYSEGKIGLDYDYRYTSHMSLRAGYRYQRSAPNDLGQRQIENRLMFDIHPNWTLSDGFTLFDRNRLEIRDINGNTSLRYRNRLQVEKPFEITLEPHRPHPWIGYASVEGFYYSQNSAFSRWRFNIGTKTNLNKQWGFDVYLCRQTDTSKDVTAHVNAIGTTVTLAL
jgi:hypothetical protein